jgi:hypothetical protein
MSSLHLPMCWVSFALFSSDFFIDLYSVDSNEAMKCLALHRFNFEVSLNASSLQIFSQRSTLHRR